MSVSSSAIPKETALNLEGPPPAVSIPFGPVPEGAEPDLEDLADEARPVNTTSTARVLFKGELNPDGIHYHSLGDATTHWDFVDHTFYKEGDRAEHDEGYKWPSDPYWIHRTTGPSIQKVLTVGPDILEEPWRILGSHFHDFGSHEIDRRTNSQLEVWDH